MLTCLHLIIMAMAMAMVPLVWTTSIHHFNIYHQYEVLKPLVSAFFGVNRVIVMPNFLLFYNLVLKYVSGMYIACSEDMFC